MEYLGDLWTNLHPFWRIVLAPSVITGSVWFMVISNLTTKGILIKKKGNGNGNGKKGNGKDWRCDGHEKFLEVLYSIEGKTNENNAILGMVRDNIKNYEKWFGEAFERILTLERKEGDLSTCNPIEIKNNNKGESSLKGKQCLYVENDDEIANLFGNHLMKSKGMEVIRCKTYEGAIKLLDVQKFHICVSNAKPGVSLWKFCKNNKILTIRTNGDTTVKMIVYSTEKDPNDTNKITTAPVGMIYMKSPVKISRLYHKLEEMCGMVPIK